MVTIGEIVTLFADDGLVPMSWDFGKASCLGEDPLVACAVRYTVRRAAPVMGAHSRTVLSLMPPAADTSSVPSGLNVIL